MKTLATALMGQRKVGAIVAAVIAAGAVGGWATSTMFATNAAASGNFPLETVRINDVNVPVESFKASLIGSYRVSGTDPDGRSYAGTHIVDIGLAPSGAFELDWDNGRSVGVGQVVGNVLAVASWSKGRTAILTMTINSDGSLSGRWSRRTDRGSKGTETWKRL
jgi:hypothetical protein